MRRHYILWKFKPGVSEETIASAFAQLETLRSIPGMRALRNGVNLAPRNGGYTHFSEMLFESPEAHLAYNTHPAHRAVADTYTIPITERALSLDFDEPA